MSVDVKLDLGCGQTTKADFIGLDFHEPTEGWENVDITCDLTLGIPFEDESVDKIYSAHFFEHLAKAEIVPMLLECRRVLKPGGDLEIIVPDLIKVLQNFIDKPDHNWQLDTVFGGQAHPGEFHKTGYWPKVLNMYLIQVGFAGVRITETFGWSQPCLTVKAFKQ